MEAPGDDIGDLGFEIRIEVTQLLGHLRRRFIRSRFGLFAPMGQSPSSNSAPAQGQDLRTSLTDTSGWTRWLPGARMLRSYQPSWLPHDLLAGLVLATVLVPIGIAYAEASGVPGIYGLYATMVPLLAYALFGPSRILVLGADSALTAVILAVVVQHSAGDPRRAIALASGIAIVAGVVSVAAGLARLGFITELLSKPIRYGYMNGIALNITLAQIPKLFGFSAQSNGPLRQALRILREILAGHTNLVALAIGAGSLTVILVLKRYPRIPGMLIAVVVATLVVAVTGANAHAGVAVVGPLPQGLPAFVVPFISFDDILPVLAGGAAVALIAFADTSVLSRTYAARLRTSVDPNQEMVGLGLANLATGLFQGFPISSSTARTAVAEAAGSKTQLTGVAGGLAVALLLVLGPNLLQHMPNAALAAVVIASAIGMVEVAELRRIYRIQRWEFWLSMVCFVGVAVFGAIPGIALAIAVAVIEFLWDAWRPHFAVLGSVDGIRGYHDTNRYPQARRIPGLVLFRWDAPLFFANAELFQNRVLDAVAGSPTPVRWVVITAEPVTDIDVTAGDVLSELNDTLRAADIALRFAEVKDPVKDQLKRFGLFARFGEVAFYATVDEAVDAYLAAHSLR
jgi:high affinity sulfate transporter 1